MQYWNCFECQKESCYICVHSPYLFNACLMYRQHTGMAHTAIRQCLEHFYTVFFSGSNISVQQKVAELVTPPSEGNSDGLAVEGAKGSAKSSDDCKTAGDVASEVSSPSTPSGSTLQSNGTGVVVACTCHILDLNVAMFCSE